MATPTTTNDAQYIISKLTSSPFNLKLDIVKLSAYTPEQLTALILRVIERLAPSLSTSNTTTLPTALAALKYPHPPPSSRDTLLTALRWLFLQHDTNPTLLSTRAFISEQLSVPEIPEGFMGYADVAAALTELQETQQQFVSLHKRVVELEEDGTADAALLQEQESATTQKERLEDKLTAIRAKVAELPDATQDLYTICHTIATQRMRAAHLASQLAEHQKTLTLARDQQRDLAKGVQEAAALANGDVVHALTSAAEVQRGALEDMLERTIPAQRLALEQRLVVIQELLGKSTEQLNVDAAKRRAELMELQKDVDGLRGGGGGGQERGAQQGGGDDTQQDALAQAGVVAAARAREEATLRVQRLHTRMATVIQSLEAALQAAPAALRTVLTQLQHLTTACDTRRTAAQQEAAELQQEVARLEASLHTKQPAKRIDTTPSISAAPVNAQAVNALLKQSKALRMRVQELESQHDAAKKKHAATTLLWESRTRGLTTQVDALSTQATALAHTRDELNTQLALAAEQAQRVQQEEEFTALQTSLTARLGGCDADVRRLQEQLAHMKQVDEDVQRQYILTRSLQTMLEAKQAWLTRGVDGFGENMLTL